MSDTDFDALQLRPDVATRNSNTFLSMESYTVTDRSNLRIMAQQISNTDPLPPSNFTGDTISPEIHSFSLNLETNSMAVTFSEPVLVRSFDPRQLVVSSQLDPASGGISYNLTGGTVYSITSAASYVVTFTLTDADVNFLETSPQIATGIANTYLSASTLVAEDTNGNSNTALSPLSAEMFVSDTSPPSITAFDLDMNLGTLEIFFDDPVNTSTFSPTSITLQNAASQRSMQWLTLSSQSLTSSPDGFRIVVSVDNADINEVKAIRSLCSEAVRTDCFITVAASIVRDPNGRSTNPVPDGHALRVRFYTPDRTRPEVHAWELDMNMGWIIISFSETIDITAFPPSAIVLSNSLNSVVSHQLSHSAELSPTDAASVLTVQMTAGDINAIQLNDMLGTNINNSFLLMPGGAFRDMFFNSNEMLVIRASRFMEDITSPSLLYFSFNTYAGVLSLTFDEIINASTFNASGLTLVGQPSQSLVSYNIRQGTTSDSNGLIIQVLLSAIDQDELSAMTNLATAPNNTYIITTMSTVQDTNGNPLNPISVDTALRVLYYLNSPVLISLEFPKYFYNEGQRVTLRVFLNTTAASDVTFTLTTEDRAALGKNTILINVLTLVGIYYAITGCKNQLIVLILHAHVHSHTP